MVSLATILFSSLSRGGRRAEGVSTWFALVPIIKHIATSLRVFEKYLDEYLTEGPYTRVMNLIDARRLEVQEETHAAESLQTHRNVRPPTLVQPRPPRQTRPMP